jgi:hypothetical protein
LIKNNITAKNPGEFSADLSTENQFLGNFLRIHLQKINSWGFSCDFYSGITCGKFVGTLLRI